MSHVQCHIQPFQEAAYYHAKLGGIGEGGEGNGPRPGKRHTCIPHRCWPSGFGWFMVGMLLATNAYLLLFVIFYKEQTVRPLQQQLEAQLSWNESREEAFERRWDYFLYQATAGRTTEVTPHYTPESPAPTIPTR